MQAKQINLLTISSLYPNNRDFKHGVFVETRLRNLIKDYPQITPCVIAPVPWFPFKHNCFGEYARFAGVKAREERHGIIIYHPRYLVIPKIGMLLTPWLMAHSIKKCIKKLQLKGQKFDVIDGHYFYPDGVAIAKVAEALSIPFTCTARGTDINLIPQQEKPKRLIQTVFKKAAHLMAVCKALKDEMVSLGAQEDKTSVLRNGVDLTLFSPSDEAKQQQLKRELVTDKKLILSVGWLIERKGHFLVIDAIKNLPNCQLIIAGDGPDKQKLEQQVKQLGLTDRVSFLGALPQAKLSQYYQSADALVLASSREGWANVLLEAMASGTPVVAANIWGTPEVIASPAAGILVERNAESIEQGIKTLLNNPPSRAQTRLYAEQFSWAETSDKQYQIFSKIVDGTLNDR